MSIETGADALSEKARPTLFELFQAWCRDSGLDPSKDENMQAFLNDVFSTKASLGEKR